MSVLDSTSRLFILDRSKALLPAGQSPDALTAQQLGIFDADTGVSLGASGAKASNGQIYFGLGVGTPLQDIIMSPTFDLNKFSAINTECFKPAITPLIVLKDIKTKCETPYSLQLLVTTNLSQDTQGFLPIRKSYPIFTACCDDPCDCASGNSCTDAAIKFAKLIMNDSDKLATAYLISNAATNFADDSEWIDPNDDAAIAAAITAGGEDFCFAIVVEPSIEKVYKFCDIPYHGGNSYENDGLDFYGIELVTTVGFECMGTIVKVRESQFAGMDEREAQLQEYMQQGLIGATMGVYRALQDGIPLTHGHLIQPKFGGRYSVISLAGSHQVHVGDNDRNRFAHVNILLPCGGGTPTVAAAIQAVLAYNGVNASSTAFSAIDACACT